MAQSGRQGHSSGSLREEGEEEEEQRSKGGERHRNDLRVEMNSRSEGTE